MGIPYSHSSSEIEISRATSQKIGEFFRHRRELASLSREQIAESLGLESTAILAGYENGEIPIPLEEIFALTNAINVPPEDVLALFYDLSP